LSFALQPKSTPPPPTKVLVFGVSFGLRGWRVSSWAEEKLRLLGGDG